MKKTFYPQIILVIFALAFTSCNKEKLPQSEPPQPVFTIRQAPLISSENENGEASRCPTLIEGVGIAYILQPIGAFGTILHIDITYSNTAPNGFLNMFLRNTGVIPSVPVWQVTHLMPPLTGTGYDMLHYDITLLPSVTFPLELAIQGSPGAGGCRTTKNVFLINY